MGCVQPIEAIDLFIGTQDEKLELYTLAHFCGWCYYIHNESLQQYKSSCFSLAFTLSHTEIVIAYTLLMGDITLQNLWRPVGKWFAFSVRSSWNEDGGDAC